MTVVSQRAGSPDQLAEVAVALLERRTAPTLDLADRVAEIVAAAQAMAERFSQGGKLLAFGTGAASTDAQHIAVEFVHPAIAAKRVLPAIALTCDAATITAVAARDGMAGIFAHQIRYLGGPADIALGVMPGSDCPSVRCGLLAAGQRGMLTVALAGHSGNGGRLSPTGQAGGNGRAGRSEDGGPAGHAVGEGAAWQAVDHMLVTGSADRRIVKEMHVATYHMLWELVHVFMEQTALHGGPVKP